MKTFLTQDSINKEIDSKLEQATAINHQAQAFLSDGDMDNAHLFCDIAEELLNEAEKLKELRLVLFSYTPEPNQEWHFILGANRVDEMVVVVDLN